jgi:hypothetical protein
MIIMMRFLAGAGRCGLRRHAQVPPPPRHRGGACVRACGKVGMSKMGGRTPAAGRALLPVSRSPAAAFWAVRATCWGLIMSHRCCCYWLTINSINRQGKVVAQRKQLDVVAAALAAEEEARAAELWAHQERKRRLQQQQHLQCVRGVSLGSSSNSSRRSCSCCRCCCCCRRRRCCCYCHCCCCCCPAGREY